MNRALLILSCLCVSLSVAGRGGWPDFHGPPFGGGGGHHGGHGGFPEKFPRGGDELAEKYCGEGWLLLTAPEVDRDNLKPGDKIECFKIFDKWPMSAFTADAFLRRHGLQLLAIEDAPMLVRVLKALIYNGWKTDGENMAWLAGFQVSDRLFVTQNGSLVSPLLSKHYGCTWSEFGEPSQCSIVDEKCVRTRERCKLVEEAEHGTCTGEATEVEECDEEDCNADVDCEWNEFGEWSSCSKECGTGMRRRERSVKTEQQGNGAPCTGLNYEEETCNTQSCNRCVSIAGLGEDYMDVTDAEGESNNKLTCIKAFKDEGVLDFGRAESYCIGGAGGQLVTLDSTEMFNSIKEKLGIDVNDYWIGVKLYGSGGNIRYRYIDNIDEEIPLDHPPWALAGDQPGGDGVFKECVYFHTASDAPRVGFVDADCKKQKFWICEKNHAITTVN